MPHCIDHRLAEKSFGIFAGRNINVLRMVYGRKTFERLTASGHEEPPAAEPLSEVYARVSEFYEECVVPLTSAGKNVLVVSHQYALEPLALYLGGKARGVLRLWHACVRCPDRTHSSSQQGPEAYAGAMDLPNGKALSVAQLQKFEKHHGSGFAKMVRASHALMLRPRSR